MGQFASSALVGPHAMNAKTTKKAGRPKSRKSVSDDLAAEYRFDYRKSRVNRFARHLAKDAVVVVLDSDVAEVFHDSKRVNSLLRATIAAVEKPRSRRAG
jgi:uncharacterized protein (DUF4415 family)